MDLLEKDKRLTVYSFPMPFANHSHHDLTQCIERYVCIPFIFTVHINNIICIVIIVVNFQQYDSNDYFTSNFNAITLAGEAQTCGWPHHGLKLSQLPPFSFTTFSTKKELQIYIKAHFQWDVMPQQLLYYLVYQPCGLSGGSVTVFWCNPWSAYSFCQRRNSLLPSNACTTLGKGLSNLQPYCWLCAQLRIEQDKKQVIPDACYIFHPRHQQLCRLEEDFEKYKKQS